jgi:hypothetical protein
MTIVLVKHSPHSLDSFECDYYFSSAHMLNPFYNHNSYQEGRAFPQFQSSRVGLFSDVSVGDSCPLRILLDKLGAAVSPTDTSGKDSTLPLVTSENPAPLWYRNQ